MSWDDDLTGAALYIATTDETPLRVMAGPGTGKSFALKRRVERLLKAGQDPERIFAVTFTRNAAALLVKDLHTLGIPNCERVRVSTLHAFCFQLLRRQDVFGYLGRVPRTVVTFERSGALQFEGGAMLDDLVLTGDFGGNRDCTKRIRAFEAAWARLQAQVPGPPRDPIDLQFQATLDSWLRFHNAMLIGELIPEALRFLRYNPASDARSLFDHVLVDEYQDLNRAEQELIDLLAGSGSTVIVGDVDQSIYRFRHANPEGIEAFKQRHPATHDETLHECWRCPTGVVTIANDLIRHNHLGTIVPRLLAKRGNQNGTVHIVQWPSIDEEVQGLAAFIRSLISIGGHTPGEILVLAPRRLLGYKVRDQLKSANIPAYSFFHEELLAPAAAQRAFALLTLLVDVEDRVALRWWLRDKNGSRKNHKEYQALRQHCSQTNLSPRIALETLDRDASTLPRMASILVKYRELRTLLSELANYALPDLVAKLLPDGNEDCSALREFAQQAMTEVEDVRGLFDRIKSHITQPETPEEGDFVRVMSLHKSKGLTSRAVIIMGCTEGLIPSTLKSQAPTEQEVDLQEQRRLFYVAITRCREILVLSSATTMRRTLASTMGARLQPGSSNVGATVASRFLDEMGTTAPQPLDGAKWTASGYAL